MSWRWKIFRAFNYFQGILNLGFIAVFIAAVIGNLDSRITPYVILPLIYFTIIVVNNFFNIHLLQKHYPDKIIPKAKEKAGIILLVLYIITIVIFIILLATGLLEELGKSYVKKEWTEFIIFLMLIISSAPSIYILIEQASLPTHIEKNNKRSIHELTNLLGKPEGLQ